MTKSGNSTWTILGTLNYLNSGVTVNAGTLILSGINNSTAATTVSGGILNLSNQNAAQYSTLTMSGTTSGLVFGNISGHAFTFGGLAATAAGPGYDIALQDNAATPNAVALTVGNNNASTTYAGNLSGSGSLTKIGSGNLTLTGTNTYTGATTIIGGLNLGGSTARGFDQFQQRVGTR